MRFTIERQESNGISVLRITDHANGTVVGILPEYGGLLHEFIMADNGSSHNFIDHYPDSETLLQQLDRSYKSAKLSPFVCRIREASYAYGDHKYEFAKKFSDGSAIHGLLFNKPFELSEQFVNEQNACITLRYHYKAEDPGYPFNYSCRISYTLDCNKTLQVVTTVENMDDRTIPIADGWHPYFRLGGKVDDWLLRFSSTQQMEFDDKLIPTGKYIKDERFHHPQKIAQTEFDNCFLLDDFSGDKPVCEVLNASNSLQLQIFSDQGYPYLQIYIPPDRQSIAIENLSGAPDCFNNRMGLLSLVPGEKTSFKLRYRVGKV
jgi:aldose 1-epimerase